MKTKFANILNKTNDTNCTEGIAQLMRFVIEGSVYKFKPDSDFEQELVKDIKEICIQKLKDSTNLKKDILEEFQKYLTYLIKVMLVDLTKDLNTQTYIRLSAFVNKYLNEMLGKDCIEVAISLNSYINLRAGEILSEKKFEYEIFIEKHSDSTFVDQSENKVDLVDILKKYANDVSIKKTDENIISYVANNYIQIKKEG